jgi:hypothetical protein
VLYTFYKNLLVRLGDGSVDEVDQGGKGKRKQLPTNEASC